MVKKRDMSTRFTITPSIREIEGDEEEAGEAYGRLRDEPPTCTPGQATDFSKDPCLVKETSKVQWDCIIMLVSRSAARTRLRSNSEQP